MRFTILVVTLCTLAGIYLATSNPAGSSSYVREPMPDSPDLKEIPAGAAKATFGAGCFWCVEEVFHQIPGVHSVVSGYMGGKKSAAHYKAVSAGRTDHAEVVHIYYDKEKVSYKKLLDVLFKAHDPTQLNRQGADRGRQYRSAVFYHDDLQKLAAEKIIEELTEAKVFGRKKIVTEVTAAGKFYPAERYHQDFARQNPNHGYLRNVLYPKLHKLGLKIPQ